VASLVDLWDQPVIYLAMVMICLLSRHEVTAQGGRASHPEGVTDKHPDKQATASRAKSRIQSTRLFSHIMSLQRKSGGKGGEGIVEFLQSRPLQRQRDRPERRIDETQTEELKRVCEEKTRVSLVHQLATRCCPRPRRSPAPM
jgi:hypothetical protein